MSSDQFSCCFRREFGKVRVSERSESPSSFRAFRLVFVHSSERYEYPSKVILSDQSSSCFRRYTSARAKRFPPINPRVIFENLRRSTELLSRLPLSGGSFENFPANSIGSGSQAFVIFTYTRCSRRSEVRDWVQLDCEHRNENSSLVSRLRALKLFAFFAIPFSFAKSSLFAEAFLTH